MIAICEPRHDKTNNVIVRSAKTQISQGIRSESSLGAQSFRWFCHIAAHVLISISRHSLRLILISILIESWGIECHYALTISLSRLFNIFTTKTLYVMINKA